MTFANVLTLSAHIEPRQQRIMVIETRRASSTAGSGSAGKTTTDKKLSDTKEKCGSCNANVKEKDRGLTVYYVTFAEFGFIVLVKM